MKPSVKDQKLGITFFKKEREVVTLLIARFAKKIRNSLETLLNLIYI